MRCAWQVEMDDECNRVLARHFPGVPRHRDIREVTADELRRVDVLTGGVPCQDWSVAGKRAGLAGKRSGLFFDFARLADTLAPTWVLFENVPGLLSSGPECGCERCEKDRAFALRYKTSEKRSREVEAAWRRIQRHKQALIGEDFATVLECLTGFRPTVPEGGWRNSGVCVGHKRGAAWRVLDAQYFGVAQRRRRVFLVASPGDGSGPIQVLFEPESCDGDSPPRRQAGTRAAFCLAASARGTGDGHGNGWNTDYIVKEVAPCLRSNVHNNSDPTMEAQMLAVVGSQTAHHGRDSVDDAFVMAYITPRICRNSESCNEVGIKDGAIADSLSTDGPGAIAFTELGEGHVTYQETDTAVSPRTGGGGAMANLVAHTLKAEGADASEDGTGRGVPLAVGTTAFNWQSGGDCRLNPKENLTDALSVGQVPAIAWTQRTRADGANVEHQEDVAYTLDAPAEGGRKKGGVVTGMVVRRLTPTECERLQGFPDGWTAYDSDGQPVSDSARYRMLGNAVAVPVAEWIGRRILATVESTP